MQVTPELIETITKQVIKSLNAGKGSGADRPKIFVLGSKDTASCLSGQFLLETASEVDGMVSAADYEAFVITQTDTALLADMAQGLCRCAGARVISEALFLGKPVYLAEEGVSFLQFKHTANARYYQMFVEYLKKLESFGVAVLSMEKICQAFSGKKTGKEEHVTCECVKKEEKKQTTESGLFSAEMARAFARTGETTLCVAQGTLITPLAKDVLREKKIKLVYEG